MGMQEPEYQEPNENFSVISTNLPAHSFDFSMNAILQNCSDWDFNIFNLEKETMNSALEALSTYAFSVYNLYKILDIPQQIFTNFIREVSLGYLKENFYHNSTHAADVFQAFYYFLSNCDAKQLCCLHDIDVAVCLISAAIHDIRHPGYNNLYLINNTDLLAIRYNDKSVLENHHLATAFTILQDDQKNIFRSFQKDLYKKTRVKIINLVLATDFSRHFGDISRFQIKLASGLVEDEEARGLCMEMMMHACDISNPTRPWELCELWGEKVMQEFFIQGDKERELGLPISYLCDRNTVVIPKSQVGFMDLFVEPTFTAILLVLPKVDLNLKILRQNKKKWNEKKED